MKTAKIITAKSTKSFKYTVIKAAEIRIPIKGLFSWDRKTAIGEGGFCSGSKFGPCAESSFPARCVRKPLLVVFNVVKISFTDCW